MQPNESYNFGGHYYYWLNLVMMNIMLKPLQTGSQHEIRILHIKELWANSWFSGGEGRVV